MLPQITDGVNDGVGQHLTLVLGMGNCRVGQPTSFPVFATGVSSPILPTLVYLLHEQVVGPVLRVHSLTLIPSGSAPLWLR